jgi:hypothetical protein
LVAIWPEYYEHIVRPTVFNAANRHLLDQWVRVTNLPFSADDYLTTVEQSVRAALRYSVVSLDDIVATLGGFPFDNRFRWYSGSDNDLLLNIFVPRVAADPAAVARMQRYNTSGVLARPLITLHTLQDQQVPYLQTQLYVLKTFFSGSLFTRHLSIPIDRYGHCHFTRDEALFVLSLMLLYDGILDNVSGTASFLTPPELTAFETRARAAQVPQRRDGSKLAITLKPR